MSKRIIGGKLSQRQCRMDGLIELAGVAQGAYETMMRFDGVRLGSDSAAECLSRFRGQSGCEQFKTTLEEGLGKRFGGGNAGRVHDCH